MGAHVPWAGRRLAKIMANVYPIPRDNGKNKSEKNSWAFGRAGDVAFAAELLGGVIDAGVEPAVEGVAALIIGRAAGPFPGLVHLRPCVPDIAVKISQSWSQCLSEIHGGFARLGIGNSIPKVFLVVWNLAPAQQGA
jgi:hypothetical protein